MKKYIIRGFFILMFLVLGFSSTKENSQAFKENRSCAQEFTWSNINWRVNSGKNGPMGNILDPCNIWVDNNVLHMKISKVNGEWHSAEIQSTEKMGFGTYTFYVDGPINKFDPNVVLGMWSYGGHRITNGGDQLNTKEIDIEIAKWGCKLDLPIIGCLIPRGKPGNFTVYPDKDNLSGFKWTYPFDVILEGNKSVHRYSWSEKAVIFESSMKGTIAQSYRPSEFRDFIPQSDLYVLINLWLYQNMPPKDTTNLEIRLTKFEFEPIVTSTKTSLSPEKQVATRVPAKEPTKQPIANANPERDQYGCNNSNLSTAERNNCGDNIYSVPNKLLQCGKLEYAPYQAAVFIDFHNIGGGHIDTTFMEFIKKNTNIYEMYGKPCCQDTIEFKDNGFRYCTIRYVECGCEDYFLGEQVQNQKPKPDCHQMEFCTPLPALSTPQGNYVGESYDDEDVDESNSDLYVGDYYDDE